MGGGWGRRWIFNAERGGIIFRDIKGVIEILLCIYIYIHGLR